LLHNRFLEIKSLIRKDVISLKLLLFGSHICIRCGSELPKVVKLGRLACRVLDVGCCRPNVAFFEKVNLAVRSVLALEGVVVLWRAFGWGAVV
jgi:hypothetical protein